MLDFYTIETMKAYRPLRIVVQPEFKIQEDGSKDLMIRGGRFYAVWDASKNRWSRNAKTIQKIIDADIKAKAKEVEEEEKKRHERDISYEPKPVVPLLTENYSSGTWNKFLSYAEKLPDEFEQLDNKIIFANTETKKEDYISRKLKYNLEDGETPAYEEIMSTLYAPEERAKIEWAIGSIICGDSKKIQKFIVFHGPMGSGKSTVMNLIEKLFGGYKDGYCAKINAKALVGSNVGFALEPFAKNPLVGIDQDSNLSRIEDNTILNQLVSHDTIQINEKFKNLYESSAECFLFMGTNEPVKITNAKSGIIRRLIDVEPTGNLIEPESKYDFLVNQMYTNELGAIAMHCLKVYKSMGRAYYNRYVPKRMMLRTDPFFNFMLDNLELFDKMDQEYDTGNYITGELIWNRYRSWCDDTGMEYRLKRFQAIDEAKSYFDIFEERKNVRLDSARNTTIRNVYHGFKKSKFEKADLQKSAAKDKAFAESLPKEGPGISYPDWLVMKKQHSLLDDVLADCKAQYGDEKPQLYWNDTEKIVNGKTVIIPGVKTMLKDLDTSRTHYVQTQENMIQIDLDKKNAEGKKDFKLNAETVARLGFPKTYAERSKGGEGIHLAYWYDGDTDELRRLIEEGVEVKVQKGDAALRRRLSLCNDVPIATLHAGALPLREKKMVNEYAIENEKHLRSLIIKALKKEIEPRATRTCVDYIDHVLAEAQEKNIAYDFSDLDNAIFSFAAQSTHQKDYCLKVYSGMKLRWPETLEDVADIGVAAPTIVNIFPKQAPIVFFDIEVFKNCNIVVYKEIGEDKKCVWLINPKPAQVSQLFNMRLVGFNNRGYDNHILYAMSMGYSPEEVYELSQQIIVYGQRSPFRDSANISYTDIYDYTSDKKSLKKWEITLGIPHVELDWPWDKEIPEEMWETAARYCENDVRATEAVWNATQADFKAREILAEIAGMTVNDSTNNLTKRIIFGNNRKPQSEFNCPDLTKKFPGYRFEHGKSYYRHDIPLKDNSAEEIQHWQDVYGIYFVQWNGDKKTVTVDELIGEGGRVFANPGMYHNVKTFDVASMHPSSIIAENGFGPYTKKFKDIMDIRIAIKHKDFDAAKKMLDGKLAPYLDDPAQAKQLSFALKIAINSVYGLTAAKFENEFKDPRNKDNWVAKRGALFMETLRLKVQEMGATVVHIKTDSIKIADPTKEVEDFILSYGKQYGYNFEIESIYDRICLVNDAVYIAKCSNDPENGDEAGHWTATGAQFQHPYVFKALFSKEPITFEDRCEVRTVTSAMYLDMNEKLPNVEREEKELEKCEKALKKLWGGGKDWELIQQVASNESEKFSQETIDENNRLVIRMNQLKELISKGHKYQFIGKAGLFCPILSGYGGGELMRLSSNGTYGSVGGTKGYRWLEAEEVKRLNYEKYINESYFSSLADEAIKTISEFGSFDLFVSSDSFKNKSKSMACSTGFRNPQLVMKYDGDHLPWNVPCCSAEYAFCCDCPNYYDDQEYCCKLGYNVKEQIMEY